jgi:uncharacterized protein DUF1559
MMKIRKFPIKPWTSMKWSVLRSCSFLVPSVSNGFLILVTMAIGCADGSVEAAKRMKSADNLMEMGRAFHEYHFHNSPPGFPTESNDGTAKLSWRVQILPFLGEKSLYDDFHHQESWDSPHNRKLLAKMPLVFIDPRFQKADEATQGATYYRGFVRSGAVLGAKPPVSLGAIANAKGASNTIVVVEAGEAMPWTKPEDVGFGANGPFGGPNRLPFLVLFADGHFQTMPTTNDPQLLDKLINWQTQEPGVVPPVE